MASSLEAALTCVARMELLAIIVALVLIVVPVIVLGVLFVWAAVKDGQEDRALQKRLGIRRRTRLGR
jgi:heme/copper-type cytochrome/quinol oxidase subunit 2